MPSTTTQQGARGQILAIMAIGLIVMLAGTGLIVDGGFAFTQQRVTQNGTDAAANAGAVVLAQTLKGTVTKTDADVLAAVNGAITANRVESATAYYTDVTGRTLRLDGTPSASLADAAVVGGGTIPPCQDVTTCVNGRASGVLVAGSKTVGTFISRIVGIESIGVSTKSTAVSGWIEELCPASSGCNVLPVTVPVTIVSCDGQNEPIPDPNGGSYDDDGTTYIIPLCQNGPGNVGWLDWTPPAGGTSELEEAIRNPNNPEIKVEGWYFVSQTGNINSSGVEDAINWYAERNIPALIPQFDSTCNTQPLGDEKGACPPPNVGGTGQNQWYHLFKFGAMMLRNPKGAYINGNNADVCDTGNGATACLIGRFVEFIGPNATVGAGSGQISGIEIVGVQLIR